MYALRRLSRQQWACSLVYYQIDPSTLPSRRITRIRNTSRGFDEVWVDPGGIPNLLPQTVDISDEEIDFLLGKT